MSNTDIINPEGSFQGNYKKAEKLLKKPDKVDKLLTDLKKKLEGLPLLDDRLTFLPKMAMAVNSYIRKQYTRIPVASIFAIVAAISYFVLPFDVVPDFLPIVGLLDDAAVIGLALNLVSKDLEDYMAWRVEEGLDEGSENPELVAETQGAPEEGQEVHVDEEGDPDEE